MNFFLSPQVVFRVRLRMKIFSFDSRPDEFIKISFIKSLGRIIDQMFSIDPECFGVSASVEESPF